MLLCFGSVKIRRYDDPLTEKFKFGLDRGEDSILFAVIRAAQKFAR
jgi:hypothetical protein